MKGFRKLLLISIFSLFQFSALNVFAAENNNEHLKALIAQNGVNEEQGKNIKSEIEAKLLNNKVNVKLGESSNYIEKTLRKYDLNRARKIFILKEVKLSEEDKKKGISPLVTDKYRFDMPVIDETGSNDIISFSVNDSGKLEFMGEVYSVDSSAVMPDDEIANIVASNIGTSQDIKDIKLLKAIMEVPIIITH